MFKIKFSESESEYGGLRHDISFGDNPAYTFAIGYNADCPEDKIIGRDLIDGNHLLHVFMLGYELGKAGDDYEIQRTTNGVPND